ncbi:MAG: DUF177 domain-containing protein [candidate division WOR-3 bacterium]|nr:MAG: DUF177 domain-containing protein [candidate division WOR-3 bacterium]
MKAEELAIEIDQGTIEKASTRIRFHRSTLGIGANFDVRYTAQLTCNRCLGHFSRDFSTELYLTYVKGKDPYENVEKVDLKKTDIDRIYYTGPCIDVLVGLREAVLLSLPITIVCKEECRGLCPVCGKDRNKETCTCPAEHVGVFTPVVIKHRSRKRGKKKT